MNKFIKTALASLIVLGSLLSSNLYASEALDQINAEVEKTAAEIDAAHGVLLTAQERNDLKLSLIVNKVKKDNAGDTKLDVVKETNTAIDTYEITDPQNQRKLLIELETNWLGGSGGVQPPQ
ncbi:MAG: hypothetical protein ACI8WB_001580 [Phenylobacterium sp.]|jgi:hypothetical protein